MTDIFEETTVAGVRFPNRLWRSATWEAAADARGRFGSDLIGIYRELAKGGVGTIVTGMVSPCRRDPGIPGIMRLHDDSLIGQYRALARAVKGAAPSCVLLMQVGIEEYLPDDGRRSRGSQGLEIDDLRPADFKAIAQMYANIAVRARKAGFDGVQIHLGHWCYLCRCLSPACNHRRDAYGGDGARRARIAADVIRAIRDATGKGFLVTAKINASDFMPGGQTYQGSLAACSALVAAGIDVIEVSANGTSRSGVRPHKDEGYFADYAAELKRRYDVAVAVVGGFRSIECMNQALDAAGVDFITICRPLIREPNLVNRWKEGDTAPSRCISCNICYQTPLHQCIFRLRGQE